MVLPAEGDHASELVARRLPDRFQSPFRPGAIREYAQANLTERKKRLNLQNLSLDSDLMNFSLFAPSLFFIAASFSWGCEPASELDGFSIIPAGKFTMGRTSGDAYDDEPPAEVTVSAFYMAKYEITKAVWDEVRTWAVANGYTDLVQGTGKGANHPVYVTWWDAVKWCNARSQREGLKPCYEVGGAVLRTGSRHLTAAKNANTAPGSANMTTTMTVNWSANGYRLPTEAEWEKAARGGLSGKRFPWGTDLISPSLANYCPPTRRDSSGQMASYHPTYKAENMPYTSPVGSFAANSYGLHDMAGNVWEWCWDEYQPDSYVNGAIDPKGPPGGRGRVVRGGSWASEPHDVRASIRGFNADNERMMLNGHRSDVIGFRVVRRLALQEGSKNGLEETR